MDVERLSTIARKLQTIPALEHLGRPGRRSMAGKLVWEALECGAYSSAEFDKLRMSVEFYRGKAATDQRDDVTWVELLTQRGYEWPYNESPEQYERIASEIEQQANRESLAPVIPPDGFTPGALASLLSVSDTTIRRHAKTAKVQQPRRGEKGRPYPLADVQRILLEFVSKSPRDSAAANQLLARVRGASGSQARPNRQKTATNRQKTETA